MKKQILNYLVITAFAVAATLTSCNKDKDSDLYADHPILGTWKMSINHYTFRADRTGLYEVIWEDSPSLNTSHTFKWTIDGTKVTITNAGKTSTAIASEIFFDSNTGRFYDVRFPIFIYKKQ